MMDPKQRDKCLKEVSLLESLKHPNIINYLDSFIEENELLIAIEWAEKGDLKRVIKKAQTEELLLDELKIWEYMYQIASALKHMQEKRIMHRDLKPANIFITADGTLKLGDLGLGRYLSSQTIEAFSRVGTPLYMSPEVLKGSGYDWKSDVWSLGCVVYELACLRSPFRKDDTKMSLYDLFQTISKGEFPPIGDRYSEELKTLVNSMIQVNPEKRLDIDQVVELCSIQLKSWTQKKPKVDIFLIMDDIQEKLKLLNYENLFCRVYKRTPVSHVYFAHYIDSNQQLSYFYDLVYWLMSLNKNKSPGPRPYTPLLSYESIGDPEEVAKHILADVKAFGIKAAENITPISIKNGYGEGVCVIINDLLNRELVRQDYKFCFPEIIESGKNVYKNPNINNEMFEEIDCEFDEQLIWKDAENLFETENLPKSSSTDVSELVFIEKDDDKKEGIIESSIDPVEWLEEAKRVAGKLYITMDPTENTYESRILQIKTVCKTIKSILSDSTLSRFFENKAETIRQEIEKISNGEKKMQKLCESQIQVLKEIADKRLFALKSLTKIRNRVTELCETYENIQNKLERLTKEIEVKTQDLKTSEPINKIRKSLKELRQEVKSLDYTNALSRHQLDAFRTIY
jgi:serine/threonine protein kinase